MISILLVCIFAALKIADTKCYSSIDVIDVTSKCNEIGEPCNDGKLQKYYYGDAEQYFHSNRTSCAGAFTKCSDGECQTTDPIVPAFVALNGSCHSTLECSPDAFCNEMMICSVRKDLFDDCTADEQCRKPFSCVASRGRCEKILYMSSEGSPCNVTGQMHRECGAELYCHRNFPLDGLGVCRKEEDCSVPCSVFGAGCECTGKGEKHFYGCVVKNRASCSMKMLEALYDCCDPIFAFQMNSSCYYCREELLSYFDCIDSAAEYVDVCGAARRVEILDYIATITSPFSSYEEELLSANSTTALATTTFASFTSAEGLFGWSGLVDIVIFSILVVIVVILCIVAAFTYRRCRKATKGTKSAKFSGRSERGAGRLGLSVSANDTRNSYANGRNDRTSYSFSRAGSSRGHRVPRSQSDHSRTQSRNRSRASSLLRAPPRAHSPGESRQGSEIFGGQRMLFNERDGTYSAPYLPLPRRDQRWDRGRGY